MNRRINQYQKPTKFLKINSILNKKKTVSSWCFTSWAKLHVRTWFYSDKLN